MKKKFLGIVLALCMTAAAAPCVNAATVASGNAGYNAEWVFDDNGTMTISGTGNTYDKQIAGDYHSQIYEVIIKNGITSLGSNIFFNSAYGGRYYYNMRNIEIPTSVKTIGSGALHSCSALRTINLPPNITLIGDEAFRGCSALITFNIPQNVTWINKQTFQGCSSLRSVYLPSGILEIEENAFEGCNSLTDVYFAGSAEEWNNITIAKGNTYLTGATIHYNNAEGEYPYEISALSLRSNGGEYISAVPENESCVVNVAVTEKLSRAERDYVFVALYDDTGALVGINYVRADFSAAHGCEFGLNIPKQTANIKTIKAYIWNSFDDMTPLCEAKELNLK